MPNYANTQLYELIEHDEEGNAHVYRGHTTQPLHKRLAKHRVDFKEWKKGKYNYVSSFEVLKHGPARIELVRVVCCFNKKEANREEGKFIRELPTCVNIRKNYENEAEWRKENKEKIYAKHKAYNHANKETIKAKAKEYYNGNKDTIKAKQAEYHHANKETRNAKANEYYNGNKDTILAKASEKLTCECGAVISRCHMSLHRKTWKHIHDFIYI